MKTTRLQGGQTYFPVGGDENFSLIPEKMAIAEVAEACELLTYLRDFEPEEIRRRFVFWVFGKLREKYRDNWLELWESYLNSPAVEHLLREVEEAERQKVMTQIDEIVKESGFKEEG